MWEQAGQFERAAEVYALGWEQVRGAIKAGRVVGEDGVMRGAGLAMKVGDCWVRIGRAREKEAEEAYSWAVQEMIRLGMSDNQKVSSIHCRAMPELSAEAGRRPPLVVRGNWAGGEWRKWRLS